MLISESLDGRAMARTRQNDGNALKAVKNSGDVLRIIVGATNFPESTSSAERIVFPSRRNAASERHDIARDGVGAAQESTSRETRLTAQTA